VCVRLHQRATVQPGQSVALTWPLERLHVFDSATTRRLCPRDVAGEPSTARAPAALSALPVHADCATSMHEDLSLLAFKRP
jgi:hypothetical protein